jgi:hypothetical protein
MEGGAPRRTTNERLRFSRSCQGLAELAPPIMLGSCAKKVFKKCIDTQNQNLVSRAPGSEIDKGFYPVGSLSVRSPITTKKQINNRERKNTQKSMYSLNQLKTLVSCGRDPARSLPFRRGFLLIPLILVGFAFSLNARPAPETPDPGAVGGLFSTADGDNALLNNSGVGNSAFGWFSLVSNTTASNNTGVGAGTLVLNNADSNTAVGTAALLLNTVGAGPNTGTQNVAVGTAAMVFNTGGANDSEGSFNDAVGAFALNVNTQGFSNNAFGNSALLNNDVGAANTAVGDLTIVNGAGAEASFNTALGAFALFGNEAAGAFSNSNNAIGVDALTNAGDAAGHGSFNNVMGVGAMADNASGDGNVAIGDSAGAGVEGSFNIYIGFQAGPAPSPAPVAESETIRIGDSFNEACFIGGISGVPVTGDAVCVDGNGQLGACAPASPGKTALQQLKATTERQAARIALQEGQIQSLTAALKQQAEQIQKVSAQLEMVRPTPRVVENR